MNVHLLIVETPFGLISVEEVFRYKKDAKKEKRRLEKENPTQELSIQTRKVK